MNQGIPTVFDMLTDLEKAGGSLPQSAFGTEFNDAADWLFLRHEIECDPETVNITDAGRERLQRMRDPPVKA